MSDPYSDWPERPCSCANVLCEGPSIKDFLPKNLLMGPVAAINHAISVPGVQVNVWATTDRPTNLWGWSEPYRHPSLKFFTCDQNMGCWQELLGEEGVRRCYTAIPTQLFGLVNQEDEAVILPTLMPLLGWMDRLGVMRIRLFGVDMSGWGSPIGHEPYTDIEKPGETWRWTVERTLLSLAIRRYRARGARIERWNRQPRRRSK